MPEISVHNSLSELRTNPEMVDKMGYQAKLFVGADGSTMPYRQMVHGEFLPGPYSMMIFFHGVGSVGTDGYLQMRIPALHFYRHVVGHGIKSVLLFPQCDAEYQWVDEPWSAESHRMHEQPSHFMDLAIQLLKSKIAEFNPDPARIYASGISMGGYGAWDIVCRMPETFAAVFSICGGADETQAPKLKHIAACVYHGADDPVVHTFRSRNMVAALKAAGCQRIRYVEVPDTQHNSWDAAFADPESLEFIFNSVNPLVKNK